MANVNNPFGFKPIRKKDGSPYNGAFNVYYAPTTYATALYIGDPVTITGTADVTGCYPEVNLSTAGATNKITGVIVGFFPTYPGQTTQPDLSIAYGKASTARYIAVCDDPDVVYEIVSSTTVAATDISTNVNAKAGTGSAYTNLSAWAADSIMTADATYQLTIERLVNRADNALGLYAHLEVSINLPSKIFGIAGV